MAEPVRRPRWRCAQPDCPAHQWQPVTALGEYDEHAHRDETAVVSHG